MLSSEFSGTKGNRIVSNCVNKREQIPDSIQRTGIIIFVCSKLWIIFMNLNSVILSNKSNLGCGILFAEAIAVPLEYYKNLSREHKLEPD